MTPQYTSAFDLPAHLNAKSAPASIAADDAHFTTIRAGLERSEKDLERRLADARQLGVRAGQEAMERDFEIHRLTARLRALRRFGVDRCLGHTLAAGEPNCVYIGRHGLLDEAGEPLLIDWRSPAAEPFFGATHAHPMGLRRRRRYHWTFGRVTDYWDEVYDLSDTDAANTAALDDQSAFIASLGSSRTPRMRDVLGTIAADQDAIIREDSRGALVVDGGPGTGKTVVALHRTAYLLYSDPRLGHRRGGVLFVGPHQPYLSYVGDVLPSLGEEGVLTTTLRDLVREGAAAVVEPNSAVAELKSSGDWSAVIDAAVRFHEQPPGPMVVPTDFADLTVTSLDWAEAFGSVEEGTAHNVAREQIWDTLLAIMADKYDDDASPDQLERELRNNHELRQAISTSWTLVEAADLVADLWSVPAYLRLCAPWLDSDEVRMLQRPSTSPWTTADLPLLDAARRRLGDPAESERRQRRSTVAASERQRMDRVIEELIAADDDEMAASQLRQDGLRDALDDDSVLAAQPAEPLAGPFAHVVVDEAQELSDAEWRMLLSRCPSRSFTIVGDRAQARRGFAESWEERLGRVGLGAVRQANLTINYRTPEEVMDYAGPVIRSALPDANVPTSIRRSEIPVRHGSATELAAILDRWTEDNPSGIGCVIGDPTFTATDRIRALTPTLAKGLEFDLVVVVDPDGFGDGIAGAVDRYVAMTRATRQLVVLTT